MTDPKNQAALNATALDWVLSGGVRDLPPMPDTLSGYGCDGCPFGTLNPCNSEQDVWHDRSEAYFDCSLVPAEKVWGEQPVCTIAQWQEIARTEVTRLRALTEAASQPREGDLPAVLPGHWTTPAGRDMALATLDDPHMARSRERISDFALANEVFLSPGIANLTDAKERIRWLSATLAALTQRPPEQAGAVPAGWKLVPVEPTEAMLDMAEEPPSPAKFRSHLSEEQAEAAALALNAGFDVATADQHLNEFVSLIALARRREKI